MPIITPGVLTVLTVGFQKAYQRGFDGGETPHDKIAMTVSSNTTSQQYGWLGQFPQFREWLTGERQLKDLQAHGFAIVNRKFESTVSVGRDKIADDQFGVFTPIFEEMGYRAKVHPDEMLFGLLKDGQTTLCYDCENFFDTDHPSVAADGSATTV